MTTPENEAMLMVSRSSASKGERGDIDIDIDMEFLCKN